MEASSKINHRESDNHPSLGSAFEQNKLLQKLQEIREAQDSMDNLTTHSSTLSKLDIDDSNYSFDSPHGQGPATPTQPNSPSYSPSTSEEMDYLFHTPPPAPAFTQPPSPPRPESRRRRGSLFGGMLPIDQMDDLWVGNKRLGANETENESQRFPKLPIPSDYKHSAFTATSQGRSHGCFSFECEPRKSLTSIEDFNRCLWPPDSTFLTMSSTFKERSLEYGRVMTEGSNSEGIATQRTPSRSISPSISSASSSTVKATANNNGLLDSTTIFTQKSFIRSDNFQDSNDGMQELQPRRKARRVMDGGPYFKERNHRLVTGHVRKLIQEAVEDGVGELDLSNLELTDLPSDICDLNFAIVYNERGSFSLSTNRLKLFLSSNQLSFIPMDVFALRNLSVLSLRNNRIESIPPEIGLLHNLVELSIGGNMLKVLPSQIALLPKLHILTVHPNPLMIAPEQSSIDGNNTIAPNDNNNDNNTNNIENEHEVQEMIDHIDQSSQLAASSLISPPESPLALQPEDVDMVSLALDETNLESPSSNTLYSSITGSNSNIELTQLTGETPSQDSAASLSLNTGLSSHEGSLNDSTKVKAKIVLPHLVTRSRFPSLVVLAGNALLEYIDLQNSNNPSEKRFDHGLDRPRKDSKISMSGDEWLDAPKSSDMPEQQRLMEVEANQCSSPVSKKRKYIFKEDVIKSYLTPYLFEIYKRARVNNLCAGCQRKFWKPCGIVVVWQEILGQSQIPTEWKGCGINGCLGVPEYMRSSSLPLSLPTTTENILDSQNPEPIVISPSSNAPMRE